MNARTLEDLEMPEANRDNRATANDLGWFLQGGSRRRGSPGSPVRAQATMRVPEALPRPTRLNVTLLVDSDPDRGEGDPRRPWFPDYEEVE